MKTMIRIFVFLVLACGQLHAADPPNILYFYVDDMGWGSIGPNTQAARRAKGLPTVQTPNLDQLAAEGINFSQAYGCTVCSPARSSQQTGFHQGHTFADRNDPNNAKKAIRSDDITMGDALSKAGYVTGYWGKWGYGGSKDQINPTLDNLQTLPSSHGYQYILSELHHVRAHTFFQPTLWSAPAPKGSRGGLHLVPNSMAKYLGKDRYPNEPALQNHADYPKTAYCDDVYAFAALDFVRTQSANYNQTGQPFFALLAVQIPHAPFGEIEKLPNWDQAYSQDPHFPKLAKQSREWAAMVTRIDAHFGNILNALADPNGDGDPGDSVVDNTLVIFMSDNGGPGGKNNLEFDANGGLKGNKGQIHEGGIRVPTVMRWPSKINASSKFKAGTSTDQIIGVTDLLPTFCELAGTAIPLGVDGVSLAPLLLGSGERRPRDYYIHEAGSSQSIIMGKYKLVQTSRSKKRKKGKPSTGKSKTYSLFDLSTDPGETKDLSGQYATQVEEMKKILIDERVDEPAGFANTYHHWTGKNGDNISNPDHWSDYEYSNAGITYQSDAGPPRVSWTALLTNTGDQAATAHMDQDVSFLALEVRGGKKAATQLLAVGKNRSLIGRNEIRIGAGGILKLEGGRVSSRRWIDIQKNGLLKGDGEVEGTLYNAGTVTLATTEPAGHREGLKVDGDYQESPGSSLELLSPDTNLLVLGKASLRGMLKIKNTGSLRAGQAVGILKAAEIKGRFANPGNQIITDDATTLTIDYSASVVTVRIVNPLELTTTDSNATKSLNSEDKRVPFLAPNVTN